MSSQVSQSPSAQNVAALLPKLHDADPDYRFMALTDLFHALTNGRPDFLHQDFNTAARAVDGILKTLDDQNGEVQNLAIKCLAPLVTKVPSDILAPLMEKLSVLNISNSVDNSIPGTALRTVVITLPRPVTGVAPSKDVIEAYSAIQSVLIPRLVGRVVMPIAPAKSKGYNLPKAGKGMLDLENESKDIDPEAVDVLIEVVRCFGPMLQPKEIEALQEILVNILESDRASAVVKRRTVVAVSILALYLSDMELSSFLSQLIESLKNSHLTPIQRRIYITILGSMARSIPSRFGPYLKTLAPFVLSALSQEELDEQIEDAAEDGEPNVEVDDVREAALMALEGFLASCGQEMRSYTEETIAAALRYLKYDPNYNVDDDEEMGGTQEDEEDDMDDFDDEFEADAGFDDDDDASWKVRRCSAKVLYTLISTRGSGDLLENGTLYADVAPILVQRFNEREENVRLEILATISSLVRKTGEGVLDRFTLDGDADYTVTAPTSRKRRRESSSATSFDAKTRTSVSAGLVSPVAENAPTQGPKADLARLCPSIVKVASRLLTGNSIPTKQAVINLLDDIISVQNGGLDEFFGQLVDPILDSIKTNTSSASSSVITTGGAASATPQTLRIAALRLVGDICKTHSSTVLESYLPKIIPGVVAAVDDKYHKISGEAITTVEQLVKVLTPPRSKSPKDSHKADLQTLYEVIVSRVSSTNADVEVRQRAIHALGILLARTANANGASLVSTAARNSALDLLSDRLKNETTRIAAVRAIDIVAALSTSKDQLDPKWIREVSLELSAQLRKANRSLRGASLGALRNLVVSPSARSSLDKTTIEGLVSALLPLLTPESVDLHLLGPALMVLAFLVLDDAPTVVTEQLELALCKLLKGDPVSGSTLEAVLTLVKNIGEKGAGQKLMNGLLVDVSVNGDPIAVGKVIGTLLVFGSGTIAVGLQDFVTELVSRTEESKQSLALSVLGEAGFLQGGASSLQPSTFLDQFKASSDKVQLAAAVALGRAGAGNVPVYMPEILKTMDEGGKAQYLLLHSIKEILQQASNKSVDISQYTKLIWSKLLIASQTEDNKAVGAECIGRLTIIDPKAFMPQLQTLLQDPTPSVRAMIIQAIRYTLSENDPAFIAVLSATLVDLLVFMLKDTDLENRRLALTTLNSASHNKPELVIPKLNKLLLPIVIQQSVIDKDLIHEVLMGPFKHIKDDGIEIRKGAYQTLYSFMETAFSQINVVEFFDRVVAGLKDEPEIRSLCNLMLTKLVILDQDETSRRLDAIADAFRKTLSFKLKDNAVKQEIEKQEESVKSVLRVTLLLHGSLATDANSHPVWYAYWEWVAKDFRDNLKAVQAERQTE